ncbi:hypothetical protein PDK24_09435 [Bacillus cereus]|nr:hypothetical protein [Bacillus cereus]
MLLNGKPEELSRYSKLKYNAQLFIQKAQELWEYSDLQIRCVYLVSDLAKKGQGVFSVAYSTFQKMFEQRFDIKISLSTVRRFFALMEKIGLLSIHVAKRKNEQQSANVYIVEQQCDEPQQEHPQEHPSEHQNIISLQEIKNDKHKTLNNNTVNNTVEQNDIIHEEYVFARKNGINKKLFFKVINEIRNKNGINNLKSYIRGAIKNVINHISFRNGTRIYDNPHSQLFYDWLNNSSEQQTVYSSSLYI